MSARDGNPYVGPSPFSAEEAGLFFGREAEAAELLSLVLAYPAVLFYSPSGAGKTSLVNARLLQALRGRHAHVRGVVRLGGQPAEGPKLEEIGNIFLYNALLSLSVGLPRPDHRALDAESLTKLLAALPRPAAPRGVHPLHVVVFDQFEEIFTAFLERWRDQEGFFDAVGAALEADPLLRVLFVMREEHLAALDPYAAMLPGRMQQRFRLERLRPKAAKLAVEGPAKKGGRPFKPGVADELVRNLQQVPVKSAGGEVVTVPGEFVEPMHLQVVCQRLWKTTEGLSEIDEGPMVKHGDVDAALADYYEDCLEEIASNEERKVDVPALRLWFEKELITDIGTRGTVFMGADGMAGGLSREVVNILVGQRLIRLEPRGGAEWYELTHDRFINPILQSNMRWLEERAEEWVRAGRPDTGLLPPGDLQRIREWEQSDLGRRLRLSELLRTYIETSETQTLKEEAAAAKRSEEEAKKAEAAAKETAEVLSRQKEELSLQKEVLTRQKEKLSRQRLFLILLFAAAALSTILTFAFWRRANRLRAQAVQAEQVAKGKLAKEYAGKPGHEYEALVLGLEAVKQTPRYELPQGTEEGLRVALDKLGNRLPLDGCAAKPDLLTFSADGALALALCANTLNVWDASTGERLYSWPEGGTSPPPAWRQVGFSPDGRVVFAVVEAGQAVADAGGGLRTEVFIADARTGRPTPWQERLKGSNGLAFSEDGSRIMAIPAQRGVVLLFTADGSEKQLLSPEQERRLARVQPSRDGRRLVTWRKEDKAAELWDTERMERPLSELLARAPEVDPTEDLIEFSPDNLLGALVRDFGDEARAVVWKQEGGGVAARFRTEVKAPGHLAFSPDSGALVIAGPSAAEARDTAGKLLRSWPTTDKLAGETYSGVYMSFVRQDGDRPGIFRRNLVTGSEEPVAVAGDTRLVEVTTDGSRALGWGEQAGLQVYNFGDSIEAARLDLAALRRRACDKLRGRKKDYERVQDFCGAPR